jgi:tetratricopeptide (TPR) repeat protein
VIHYRLRVPEETSAPVTIDVKLQYRKFDTTYMRHVHGDDYQNDLPIVTIATDTLTLPASEKESAAPLWVRWNDYGIGLLRKGDKGSRKGELRQAEEAFREVERLGHPEGPLNLARVYIKEGRLEDAVEALRRAAAHDPPAAPWSVAWFTGIVNKQNGHLDDAIENFLALVGTRFPEARARGFDFGEDYRLLNELGKTFFERAKRERHAANRARRSLLLHEAVKWFEKALAFDPENVTAHYNLGLLFEQLGEKDKAERHRSLHGKYKLDDNARERAVAAQRSRNPAADHAAEAIVIYDLERRRQ